jgi:hypothetical protein
MRPGCKEISREEGGCCPIAKVTTNMHDTKLLILSSTVFVILQLLDVLSAMLLLNKCRLGEASAVPNVKRKGKIALTD